MRTIILEARIYNDALTGVTNEPGYEAPTLDDLLNSSMPSVPSSPVTPISPLLENNNVPPNPDVQNNENFFMFFTGISFY